jgi:hypothetical protein
MGLLRARCGQAARRGVLPCVTLSEPERLARRHPPHARAPRLRDDHLRARRLGSALSALPFVGGVAPVDTNIAIFNVAPGWDAKVGMLVVGRGVAGDHVPSWRGRRDGAPRAGCGVA